MPELGTYGSKGARGGDAPKLPTVLRKGWAALVLLAGCLILLARPAFSQCLVREENTKLFGRLLTDLVQAYEKPKASDADTIASDLSAIRSPDGRDERLAQAIAGHWQQVYLDRSYPMYLHRKGSQWAEALQGAGIEDRRSHAFIVLGYALVDGEMTRELKGRCNAAAAAARQYPHTLLVCTGGATGSNNPEKHTEAGLMKAYLTGECGIAAERIYIDEEAMTTMENAVNTFRILQENGVETMTLVTSSYHQKWGQAVYNTVLALYRETEGYAPRLVANYCHPVTPVKESMKHDDRIAASQIGRLLGLPSEDMPKTR